MQKCLHPAENIILFFRLITFTQLYQQVLSYISNFNHFYTKQLRLHHQAFPTHYAVFVKTFWKGAWVWFPALLPDPSVGLRQQWWQLKQLCSRVPCKSLPRMWGSWLRPSPGLVTAGIWGMSSFSVSLPLKINKFLKKKKTKREKNFNLKKLPVKSELLMLYFC